MKKTLKITQVLVLLLFSFHITNTLAINNVGSTENTSGIWIKNYPTISKGLTAVIIKIRLTEPGNVYYAFYDTEQSEINAAKIKQDAITPIDTHIQKSGIIKYPSVPGAVSIRVDGFDEEQEIYLYMVTESNTDGLIESDLKYNHFSMHFKHKIVPIDSTTAPYGYLEYLPANYSGDTIYKFPLIIFLHGSGGTGNGHYDGLTNPSTCMREGLTRYLELNMDLPAVVISPQTPSDWSPLTVDAFLDFLLLHYNVNPDRVYITGISMGGGGAWRYALTYYDKIAAVVPLCGAWNGSANTDFSGLATLPVWAFHNDLDPTVSVSSTYTNINMIIKAGGHPFMSIFRSDDHSCAYEAYYYPHLWDWLFAQERGKPSVQNGLVNANKCNEPVVDGFFDEKAWGNFWNDIPYNLDANKTADSKFALLWNSSNLYAGVSLSKEFYTTGNKEITLYFNGNNNSIGTYDAYDFKFTLNSIDNSITPIEGASGIIYKWAETDSSYNLEFAFPFSKTPCPLPIAGDGFGFDIQINATDANNGLQKTIFWKGNPQDSIDTRLFGNILLSVETNEIQTNIESKSKEPNIILCQNNPNPFSLHSNIQYYLSQSEMVTLSIYDLSGKELKTLVNLIQPQGYHSVDLDASVFSNGIYFYCLQTSKYKVSKKFSIIK